MFPFFGKRYAGYNKPDLFCDPLPSSNPNVVVGTEAKTNVKGTGKEFDFVICGGGTAGCVLASRLSENPEVSVLMIEAGESDQKQLHSKIPAGWANLWKSPAEWDFSSTPQPNCNDRELYVPRGKMLGGCSSINAQIYQHCSPEDYDAWEKLGAKGWSWKDLQPYFAKAEKFTPNPEHKIDESIRGKNGEWGISYPPTIDLTKAFIETGPALGIPHNPDLNNETNTSGITRFQATVSSNGQRSSTSAAYLTPRVFGRKNLSILTGTTCSKLVFSPTPDADGNLVASGVELAQSAGESSQRWVAKARKQVLVCQGAFGTPQLLLCSGVGRKETLEKAGVRQTLDVPGVGEKLKDHIATPVAFSAKPGSSDEWMKSPAKTIPSLIQWLIWGTGPLSSNVAESAAFCRSEDINLDGTVTPGQANGLVPRGSSNASGPQSSDLEIVWAPLYFVHHAMEPAPNPSGDYFVMAPVVLKPFSYGSVTISSGDAFAKPVIDMACYKDERDLKVALAGLRLIRRFSQTAPLKDYILDVASPSMSLSDWANATDEQLMEQVKAKTDTLYHPLGSCKIGAKEDGGVVSSELRIHGLANVRICDASVFPDAVSGHPVAAVVAMAEKFADMLKLELA
ncbi:hypothetical protein JCM11641_001659 [Rhodosporidiobolus odoratus]